MVFYPRGTFPPASNTERQREFRRRNPGYYQRLHAKRRAALKELAAQRRAVEQHMMMLKRMPLMLPAPVEAIEIPGMTIPAVSVAIPIAAPSPIASSHRRAA